MSAVQDIERPRTRVVERSEEQITALDERQQAAVRTLANDLHRLNQAVMNAVEAGICVELVRSSRHHSGKGSWGDLLVPLVIHPGR